MHPALRQYVGPPAPRTGRYLAMGAVSGLVGVAISVAIVRFAEHRRAAAWSRAIAAASQDRGLRERPSNAVPREASGAIAQAHADLHDFAFVGFPSWAAAHPELACPAHLADLAIYVRGANVFDPWGMAYRFDCSQGPLWVTSAGPDRELGTEDDLRSDR